MQARLKTKLSHWKNKCLAATGVKRMLRSRLTRREQRISILEAEVKRLKQIATPQGVPGHTYPIQMIALAVFMVVEAGSSLRCAAKTIGFFSHLMGWSFSAPSHVSIRNWVLRCGLYSYEHAEEKYGNYVGILDESIQIGREKLLLLLGVKLADDRSRVAPLSLSEVEVLGMEVSTSWKGDQIADFLQQRLSVHPKLALQYLISDQGASILSALRKLGIEMVGDCTHVMMNISKRLLAGDERLSQLSAQIGRLRQQLTLTKLVYLLPPSLRDKDRFLRIFTIVDWADKINLYWDKLAQPNRDKLLFLQEAKPLIEAMRQLKELIIISADLFKHLGLSHRSIQLWKDKTKRYAQEHRLTAQAEEFIEKIHTYIDKHQSLITAHHRLLCCSDIIESTFGKYKNKGGVKVISADVLSIALYNREISTQFTAKALTTIKQNDVQIWTQKYTCENRFRLIRRMDNELKNDTGNL